jgi:serine/threonine protein kinase
MADPEKIGKYTILQRIGRGGMGFVYRAHDPILKRDVALKTMLKDVSDDPELRNRFVREAQSAGGLRHPNIVTIYDLGEDDQGCPFIAMEFLTGTDLEHIIKNKIDLPLAKKLDILIQTCDGLGFAHSNGIVHRDIKAANIRVLDNGQAKIMDFGIAKITSSHFTRTGMIMGTPHYMAPEQIRGEKVDGRADIFSLGVVLYELLTYRKPFPGDNPTTVLFKIIHEVPDPLVDAAFVPPPGLEDIVSRALAKKPEDRYQTCEEMSEDLRYVLGAVHQTDTGLSEQAAQVLRPGATPLPTMRRTPGTGAGKTSFTLPSQQRLGAAGQTVRRDMPGAEPAPPTQLAESTQATVLAQDSEARPELPPISPTPIPTLNKFWWIAGSTGLLGIVLLIAVFSGLFKRPEVKPPPIGGQSGQAQAPPVERKGWVVLNVHPWAEIEEIKNDKGEYFAAPFNVTPCKFQLPEGKYRITLSNKKYETKILELRVIQNETIIIQDTLKGFDYAKAVESLGL